jgi:xylulokinase
MGIDVGSSSVKVAVYHTDGILIGVEREDLNPQHLQAGWWEQDPEEVWHLTSSLIRKLMKNDTLRRDPPQVLAISASVRENFPADRNGNPLASCIMAADTRGEEYETPPAGAKLPEGWSFSCGHTRERMDPLNRLLWWRKNRPDLIREARYFPGWHEFLSLRMCGQAVLDGTIASRWLLFDLASMNWDQDRAGQNGVQESFLPKVLPWGTVIGDVKMEIAEDWGIFSPLKLAVGAADLNCAALGAGVTALGEACMASGTFENLLVPTSGLPSTSMLLRGLSVTPHPGAAGRAIWAICPTGTAVVNWSRNLLHLSIEEVDRNLSESEPTPSPVLAVPFLSGAFINWQGGRKLRGALFELALATSQIDIVKAMMESIAYEHVNTTSLLREEGVGVEFIRATGGGTRSRWWTQLKADVMGIPIGVVDQPEPGTLGAALLAGYAIGAIGELGTTSRLFSGTARIHEPNPKRAEQHLGKMRMYRERVGQLLMTS